MKLKIYEIKEAINGEILKKYDNRIYETLTIDTRKITEGCVFLAIKGENFNGNDFAIEAIEKGAKLVIVDEIKFLDTEKLNATIIKVDDTREALKSLAKYYRESLDIKIIGVTGSVGKTSTKDLIAAALSSKKKVFKTKGNFNNDIGLPLMILELDETYDVAVLEMGMSNLKEIEDLARIAMPDIGVITNIGISHIEKLKTRDNILKAKMEITTFFNKDNTLIINADDDMLSNIKNSFYTLKRIGIEHGDINAKDIQPKESGTEFSYDDKVFKITALGKHNVLNAMFAIECGKILNLTLKDINEGFKSLEVSSMRLDIKTYDKIKVINDAYNASPDSMKAAIDIVSTINGRKILVLGTMFELGEFSEKSHYEVGVYAKEKSIDKILVTGEYSFAYINGFDNINNSKSYYNKEELLEDLKIDIKENDVILIKASRGMKFEVIEKGLRDFLTREDVNNE